VSSIICNHYHHLWSYNITRYIDMYIYLVRLSTAINVSACMQICEHVRTTYPNFTKFYVNDANCHELVPWTMYLYHCRCVWKPRNCKKRKLPFHFAPVIWVNMNSTFRIDASKPLPQIIIGRCLWLVSFNKLTCERQMTIRYCVIWTYFCRIL